MTKAIMYLISCRSFLDDASAGNDENTHIDTGKRYSVMRLEATEAKSAAGTSAIDSIAIWWCNWFGKSNDRFFFARRKYSRAGPPLNKTCRIAPWDLVSAV